MNERLNESIRQIQDINWNNIGKDIKNSHIILAKEYLRRSAIFKCKVAANCSFPFVDASSVIGKEPKIDLIKACIGIEVIEKHYIRQLCEAYLKWVSLVDDGDTIDWSNQCSILADVGNKIENFYYDDCFIELKKMYNSYHLIVTGETKRKGPEVEAVYELFRYISVIAPGSYGLLYTRDEFLSPCIPVIDDEM